MPLHTSPEDPNPATLGLRLVRTTHGGSDMKIGPQFEDYDWRNGSASAYSDSRPGLVMVEYDENILFDDEVVGQAITWPDHALPTASKRAAALPRKSKWR
jgi:hypothetical protein